jgi:hypothetical protein
MISGIIAVVRYVRFGERVERAPSQRPMEKASHDRNTATLRTPRNPAIALKAWALLL